MADNYMRQEYPKTGSTTGMARGKTMSQGSMEMISGGGSGGNNSGPTGSSRMYPKGNWTPNAGFNPMDDKLRGGTDWAVGGV